jgi:GH15 family glucan-1,4-alpha-glucosidase
VTAPIAANSTAVAASLKQIQRCRYPSGLYAAVPPDSSVIIDIYRAVWIRDSFYTLMAFEALGEIDKLREGVYALVDHVLLRWAYKLDWRIVEGVPAHDNEYLHPRYDQAGTEIHSELWGLRQDDAVGLAIWALSRWQERYAIFRNDHADFHLVQKLIWYCDATRVGQLPDSGMWEEEEPTKAIHLSSLGAVAAGLKQAERIGVKDIPERLSMDTSQQILMLAGRESSHHDTDLALLTLLWPYGIDLPIPISTQSEIVERVENELLGQRGVIRYAADAYNNCHDGPPEWTMGLGFLALAWDQLGNRERARMYLRRLEASATDSGELPESWCREPRHDKYFNSPLCWSHALHVVAASQISAVGLDLDEERLTA